MKTHARKLDQLKQYLPLLRDQADVLVRTRAARDALHATPMDRPEWIAVHPKNGDVYVSLTNNASHGNNLPDGNGLSAVRRIKPSRSRSMN